MYIHLHWHSHYSLLEAIWKPKDLVREAKDYGMTALALTDYNGLFWAVEFYRACKDAEINPIIWVELWYVYDLSTRDKNEDCGNIVLLAKNYTGYQQLLKIVSEANLHGRNNDKARIDHALLSKYTDGLMILISGMQSHAAKLIIKNEDSAKISEEIAMLATLVGKDNLIIELTVQDESEYWDIKKANTALEKLASGWEYRLTCANNYHYIDAADQKVSEVALAIKDGKRMFDEDRRKVSMQKHIMNEEEIRQILGDNGYEKTLIDQMVENTQTIADSIQLDIPMDTILFPKYESPDNIKELYEKHKDELTTN